MPDTRPGMVNLALALRERGQSDEADALHSIQASEDMLAVHKTSLGTDHKDTLTSMTNLAWTYEKQGRRDDSAELQVQVLETRQVKFGAAADHDA